MGSAEGSTWFETLQIQLPCYCFCVAALREETKKVNAPYVRLAASRSIVVSLNFSLIESAPLGMKERASTNGK